MNLKLNRSDRRGVLTRPQKTIFSAASIIMVMVAVSRLLGLIRNRILAGFFSADQLAVYFAAFRLPEVVFEILVYGALSSAFIPVLAEYFAKGKKKSAQRLLSVVLSWSIIVFGFFGVVLMLGADWFYGLLLPGFSPERLQQTIGLARVLIFAQMFFVISYFLTAFLETKKRFLVPAIAPLFYNLGIILGAVFLTRHWGLYGLTGGAVLGAFGHLIIQLPFCYQLGWKFRLRFNGERKGLLRLGRLAWPRMVELGFLQLAKSVELFLASLVSGGAYTFLSFAQSLQQVPVSLFGVSIAKASLPTLSYQARRPVQYRKTFLSSFHQVVFLTVPAAVFLIILRLPLVRLFFGSQRFDWGSTLQTSYALSAYALGVPFFAITYLLNRSFYALQDTRTPVKISVLAMVFSMIAGFVLVRGLNLPVWALALAASCGSAFQVSVLVSVLNRRCLRLTFRELVWPVIKMTAAACLAGLVMFFLIKGLDAYSLTPLLSLGLSFPGEEAIWQPLAVDTRYGFNLLILSGLISVLGGGIYFGLSWWWRIEELFIFSRIFKSLEKAGFLPRRGLKKKESLTVEDGV